jgi:spoIIIJ-associated protein
MSFYDFTGKTVREAIARACEELGVEEPLLEIEVLEESTRGFLGIVGQRDARIRVRKRNVLREVMEAEPTPPVKEERPAPTPPTTPASTLATTPPTPVQDVEEDEPYSPEELLESEEDADRGERSSMDPSEYLDTARAILEKILALIPVEAEVHASVSEGAVSLDIKGDGSGLLIGKKGQTLDALQFIVSKIINRDTPPGSKVDIVVDTENYRMRKMENLREMALKMSQKARKTLKPVSLSPMAPHERRIIHLILAEDKEVYTKSYGEGPLRRIIVYPRRGATNRRRRR